MYSSNGGSNIRLQTDLALSNKIETELKTYLGNTLFDSTIPIVNDDSNSSRHESILKNNKELVKIT